MLAESQTPSTRRSFVLCGSLWLRNYTVKLRWQTALAVTSAQAPGHALGFPRTKRIQAL